jgi:hypothetical protein
LATPLAETDGHDVQIQLLFAAQKLIKAGYSPLEGLNAGFVESRLKKTWTTGRPSQLCLPKPHK